MTADERNVTSPSGPPSTLRAVSDAAHAPDATTGRGLHRPLRWWPIGAALLGLLTVIGCAATSWVGIWGSHPAYRVTLFAVGLCSLGLLFWGWWTSPAKPHGRGRTIVLRGLLALSTAVTIGLVVYLRPLSADQVAIDAMRAGAGVTVWNEGDHIRLQPDAPSTTGLVFYPGAKVDPRAYVRILRPVAEAGYPVIIVKFPFNLAVLGMRDAGAFIGAEDLVQHWVVGGHSLGGAMAASYATDERDELDGLLLWAAYPPNPMTERTTLDVTSVFGTNDGLATVADIEASKADLPPGAQFVPIDGGIHAFFGDYGSQAGDGSPTISREDAQAQIVDATLIQLARIDQGAP